MEKIKFYVNPEIRIKNISYTSLLVPFWEKNLNNNAELIGRCNFDTDYYEIVEDIEKSDFVLVPYLYNALVKNYKSILKKYVNEAYQNKKPILLDGTGDIEKKIRIKNSYILRTGGYRFSKKENEITIPYFIEDSLGEKESLIREKGAKPIIGFAGWAVLNIKFKIKAIIKEAPFRIKEVFVKRYGASKKGIFFREKAVSILSNSNLVTSNFIIRKSYSGNKHTAEKDMNLLKKEFVENLINSDYGLAIRGDANSSVRFYEILSLGRIPLLLDTECNLPFSNIINYKEFCVFVDFRDLKNIDKIIFDFHQKLTNTEFKDMQIKAREAYLKYFKANSFTKYLITELSKYK